MVPTYDCFEDRCIHDITNHNLLPYCIKQIDSMLLCACTEKKTHEIKMWEEHQWHTQLHLVLSSF